MRTPKLPFKPKHAPLCHCVTSPPQGGRSGSAKHVSFACTNSHRHPSNSNPLPQNAPHFFPTFRAHAILAVLPPPDGSRTFRLRREGMPRCDASRRRARHPGRRQPTRFRWRAAPLRGRAKPATGPGPDPSLRHAGRGGTSGPGLWRTCLRKREQGPCRNPRPKHLPRPVQAAAGATRAESPEEGQVDKPAPCACEAAACRMRTSSGKFRAARVSSATHTTFVQKALPRAALRTSFFTPRRHCRAAMRPAAMMGVPQPLFFGGGGLAATTSNFDGGTTAEEDGAEMRG